MTDYMTEEEQIENIKLWIKTYGPVIVTGIVIAIVAMSGYRFWQEKQARKLGHASSLYDTMLTKRVESDLTEANLNADKLLKDYSSTTYSEMAAFMKARNAISNDNLVKAQKQLQYVIDHTSTDAFKQIARIRLARVLIANKQPKQALSKLQTVDDKTFSGLINEVKGDAYVALKKTDLARSAYKQALNDLPNAEVIRPLLQMKYDNLAEINA